MKKDTRATGLLTIITMGLLGAACSGAPVGDGDSVVPGDTEVAVGEPTSENDGPGSTVRGSVHDAVGGGVVADATVCAASLGQCSVAGPTGSFELEITGARQDVSVYVVADGYYPARSEAHVIDSGAWLNAALVPHDSVDLGPMATEAGVLFRVVELIGTNPAPLEGVEVHVGEYGAAYTNDDGRFGDDYAATGTDGLALLSNVPLGRLDIDTEESFGAGCQALADGGMVTSTTLSLEAGTITAVDIVCY